MFIKPEKQINMDTKCLKELFESRKNELALQLEGLSLPKDSKKIQSVVSSYLNTLFDSNGEFRQSLTLSEDYILQAAMSLLNAQQSIVREIADCSEKVESQKESVKIKTKDVYNSNIAIKKEQLPFVIGGTAVGGTAGALLLGSWGAVFGAIAGTALVLYYSTIQQQSTKSTPIQKAKRENVPQKINVESFLNIVGSICDSIDSLILTFSSQIDRVVLKYENQEKPVLEKEYGALLDSVQSLLGVFLSKSEPEKKQKKIDSRIEQLGESLENYGLEVVSFSEETKSYFDEQISEKVLVPTMVLPAIVKNGVVVRKGKVFVK